MYVSQKQSMQEFDFWWNLSIKYNIFQMQNTIYHTE